jgi:hypothetical protein
VADNRRGREPRAEVNCKLRVTGCERFCLVEKKWFGGITRNTPRVWTVPPNSSSRHAATVDCE